MTLLTSRVPRSLETKPRLFGFELGDLLLVFTYLATSNLLFGSTRLKFPVVWLGTLVLAGSLHYLKKGKADNHLQHLGEFFRQPTILSQGAPDTDFRPYRPLQRLEVPSCD